MANSWGLIALLSPDEKEVLQASNEQVRIYQNLYNKDQSIDHLLDLIRTNINLSYSMGVQRNALAYPYFELLKEKIEKEPSNSMEELCITLDQLEHIVKENGDLYTYMGMQDNFYLDLELSLELDDFSEEKRNTLVQDVIIIAKDILNNEKLMDEAVQKFTQAHVANKYARVLYDAKYRWNTFGGRLKTPLSYHDSKLSVAHIKKLIAKSQEQQEDQVSEHIQDLVKCLLKLPLAQRNDFVNNSLMPQLEEYHSIIRALQQLGHGRHSVFYMLPILDYSPELMALIQTESCKLQKLFQSLPHLQDIKARSKARKQSQLSYEIKELPKNPLDIDFGRDSGCCVQVEKEGEIKGNGFTVPSFLLSESIRLFAIYQIKASGKKQRVGFINSFDAEIYLDKANLVKPLQGKVLALNSVELSSSNVAGGDQSIEAIVEYVKTWMTQYIKQSPLAYIGLSMGDLYYNYACRQQTPLNDYLQVDLTIPKYYKPIYSDIITKELGEQSIKSEYYISQLKSYWWINPCANLGLSDLKLSEALSEFLRHNHYLTLGTLLNTTSETLIHQGLDQVLLQELKQILGSLSLSLGQKESVSQVA